MPAYFFYIEVRFCFVTKLLRAQKLFRIGRLTLAYITGIFTLSIGS